MTYDPEKHHRRSIRLKGYDYTQPGAYFVTICVQGRQYALGDVVDGEMTLSDAGHIVQACWDDLPNHYPHVQLDAFAIMPNHVHGVVVLVDDDVVGAGLRPAPTIMAPKRHGLPEIVRAFKSFSARRINEMHNTAGVPFWQRGFYDHIVRNEREMDAIHRYTLDNPLQWALDLPFSFTGPHASTGSLGCSSFHRATRSPVSLPMAPRNAPSALSACRTRPLISFFLCQITHSML